MRLPMMQDFLAAGTGVMLKNCICRHLLKLIHAIMIRVIVIKKYFQMIAQPSLWQHYKSFVTVQNISHELGV
jgi:hypothetical protein